MASSPSFLSFLTLFTLSFLSSSSSSSSLPNTITIPLYHKNPSSDPLQTLNFLTSASISRAHHLKWPKSNSSSSVIKTPLYPRSYGAYSINLSFGTPPQTTPFVMDTGSSLVWFPCTSRYLCSRCSFPNIDPESIPRFLPKLSSSSKLIGCQNPKCKWALGPDVKCKDCYPNKPNCTQTCPAYIVQYGSGSTAGLLLSDTLDFPGKKFPDFLVGCSFLSIRLPSGIAGFGRGPESVPSQLGLTKFSYCLVSRRFDDSPVSSDLVLYRSGGEHKTEGVISYTPFQKSPSSSNSAYREYYYVLLRKVIVGDKPVKIPYKYLVPGSKGNGGTIVDSGSTFTFMEKPVYEAVTEEFVKQMGKHKRDIAIENQTGLKPCYDISKEKSVDFPELVFQFKGGQKMVLPIANYFALVTSNGVVCLTIVTNNVAGPELSAGPAIILGSFQQQNFHIEYDLKNGRFGFRRQNCLS